MKILLIHNRHRSGSTSGDDNSFKEECKLLRDKGHNVFIYSRINDEYDAFSIWQKALMPGKVIWARDSYKSIKNIIQKERPEVVNFHNIFPLISPSSYYACADEGVPVVQTLRDYRFICPMAFLFRKGKVCEDCVNHGLYRSLLRICLHNSLAQTGLTATMIGIHRLLGTWENKITLYIALTEFSRQKFIEAGLPAQKIVLKPNFVTISPEPEYSNHGYAAFLGRLGKEKGVNTLLQAWRRLSHIPLRIIGDGPDREEFMDMAATYQLDNIEFIGFKPREESIKLLKKAKFVITPSLWYECFPLAILEAFACGKPVIASKLGSMAEIVEHGRSGLLFEPGNAEDLASKVRWLYENENEIIRMGKHARAEFESKYTDEINYQLLIAIYEKAIELNSEL